jgi:large subunit ribosomal protein L22
VADLVRGMRVEDALTALHFSPKHAAADVAKAVRSAAANAEHNFNLDRDELFVKTILVDEGPKTFRRSRPVSRGGVHPYVHATSHITVVVEDRPDDAPTSRRSRTRRARAQQTAEVEAPSAPPEPELELETVAPEEPVAAPEPEDESASETVAKAEPEATDEVPEAEAEVDEGDTEKTEKDSGTEGVE